MTSFDVTLQNSLLAISEVHGWWKELFCFLHALIKESKRSRLNTIHAAIRGLIKHKFKCTFLQGHDGASCTDQSLDISNYDSQFGDGKIVGEDQVSTARTILCNHM